MTLQEFEKELKENVHSDVKIIPHPTNTDMAGVYVNGMFVCGCPSGNIYKDKRKDYTDAYGRTHATTKDVYNKLARFYMRLQNEPGFVDLMKSDPTK